MRSTIVALTLLLLLIPSRGPAQQRKFFLTKKSVPADETRTACGEGFHMAAVLELLDPGAFQYDTTNGMKLADSGSGPPSGQEGWLRSGTAGRAWSCNLWTNNTDKYGAWVLVFALEQEKGPRAQFSLVPCDRERPVWCIED